MGCGSSKPLVNQINPGIHACQLTQSTNDLEEAKLHLQRAINSLVGDGDARYDGTVGGMQYVPRNKEGDDKDLGKGIIPDLKTVRGGGYPTWQSADADRALEAAESALEAAEGGLGQIDINKLKQAANEVAARLQSALTIARA